MKLSLQNLTTPRPPTNRVYPATTNLRSNTELSDPSPTMNQSSPVTSRSHMFQNPTTLRQVPMSRPSSPARPSRRDSNPFRAASLFNPVMHQSNPATNQSRLVMHQSNPAMSQCRLVMSRFKPVMSQLKPAMSQCRLVMSRFKLVMSQFKLVMSQFKPATSRFSKGWNHTGHRWQTRCHQAPSHQVQSLQFSVNLRQPFFYSLNKMNKTF